MRRINLSHRIAIESGLYQRQSFKKISEKIGISAHAISKEIRLNRTISPGEKPFGKVVEMDTVNGCCEKGKRMLTFLFRESNLMLIILMRDGKAATVVEQFDYLTSLVGVENFRKIFPEILRLKLSAARK